MLNMIKTRIKQGYQAIPDVRKAILDKAFRGFPRISNQPCPGDCRECIDKCPTQAIEPNSFTIDLGKCIFCGDCQSACPNNKIEFSHFHKLASSTRDALKITGNIPVDDFYRQAIQPNHNLQKIFQRSLKLRQVSAAGCNGCEMELNACSNVNFDMQRFGIEFVASPRHADGIVITGPVSQNMAKALEETYHATPGPKLIILAGTCAISGGVFATSAALQREFIDQYPIDLFVPGCPVHPLTFINGILDFLYR